MNYFFPMLVSSYFKERVLAKSQKGYCFDSSKRRVEAIRRLDAQEINELIAAFSTYGFSNIEEANNAIEDILRNEQDWQSTCHEVTLLEMTPGNQIKLDISGKGILHLIYIGSSRFIVCHDDNHLLLPGDRLLLLDSGFTCETQAVVRIFRGGTLFPDDIHFFRTDKIKKISIFGGNDIKEASNNVLTSLNEIARTIVFAWKPFTDEKGHGYFIPTELTDDSSAIVSLNLIQNTFDINPAFDLSHYRVNECNNLHELLDSIAIINESNNCSWKNIKPVKAGRFEIKKSKNEITLSVVEKAQVNL